MHHQLRTYQVKPGEMDAFLRSFDQVVAARQAHGFEIEGVWYSEEENVFAWVVSHGGPESFEEAVERYYDSDERKAIHPEPASFLVETNLVMVDRYL